MNYHKEIGDLVDTIRKEQDLAVGYAYITGLLSGRIGTALYHIEREHGQEAAKAVLDILKNDEISKG